MLATTNISEPFRIFLLGRFPSIIYKSHIHDVDKSSTQFFPGIDCHKVPEIVPLNISHLLAQLIGQDGQLHLPQCVYENIVTFRASFVTKTPALKGAGHNIKHYAPFFVFAQKLRQINIPNCSLLIISSLSTSLRPVFKLVPDGCWIAYVNANA